MSPGLVVALILLVGLALVIAATVADRRSERRVRGAPERHPLVQQPAPEQAPQYLTSAELLANAPAAARMTPDEERRVAAAVSSAAKFDCRLAAQNLATHTGSRAILNRPLVLVCSDTITEIRELLHTMGAAAQDRRALLVAAPQIDADTLQTIIANKLAGTLEVAVVLGEPDALDALAAAAGTAAVTHADRQAGRPATSALGRAEQVVASEQGTWLVAAAAGESD